MNVQQIADVLDRKRAQHPELARPLSWDAFARVVRREAIALYRHSIKQPAKLVQWEGQWGIVVKSSLAPRQRILHAAHELAHIWLHVDERHERFEQCINYSYPGNADPREREADYLATAMIAPKRLADRLEPAAMVRRATAIPAVRAKERPVPSAAERFPVEVAATTFWQETLKSLLGKRHWMATPFVCEANLGPDDPLQDRFPFPIRVEVRGRKIGYLSRADAERFRRVHRRKWLTVPAVIVRDVSRREYGVRLDVDLDAGSLHRAKHSA